MQILPAHDAKFVPRMRALFQEYAAATGVDLCFQGFSEELAGLPGKYAPPKGRLFLAECDRQPAGCVALRKFDQGICEMKRLYVRPSFRGRGIGRSLAAAVIEAAREIGYRSMRLDTLVTMKAAVVLYRSMGFRETTPYYDNPLPDVLYFNLELS
jgi:carbonic anhydrase